MIGQDRAADGTALLRLSGELDINTRDDLREALVAAVGTGDVVIDLDEVTFIDSEALGALIEGYNAARANGTGFRLINAHGLVDRVLSVSGVLDIFGS